MTVRRIEGKIAMVTGGAAGIGRAISQRLAAEGATVVICDVDALGAHETKELVSGPGTDHHHVELDVRHEEAWESALEIVRRRYGRLDVLVNNAGRPYRRALPGSSWDDWQDLMTTNAGGMFLGMKHGAPALAAAGGGAIVNISSAAALVGVPNMTTYSAAKGAVRAMSRAAAAEFAHARVRVNSIYPTSVPTAMLASDAEDTGVTTDEFATAAAALSPLPGMASVDDVAAATIYLASDEAQFVTGAEIAIDGGATSLIG